jgi:hypothetical protein
MPLTAAGWWIPVSSNIFHLAMIDRISGPQILLITISE